MKTKKSKISSIHQATNNKGQMKIQQMAFMLIAVTLFFVLVGMFFLVVKFSDIKKTATELCEKNAMLLAEKLANSPEFSCGESFDGRKTNCVDTDKVMALTQSISKYSGFWDVTNIEIRKIYPAGSEVECSMSNYPDCNLIKVRKGENEGTYIQNFVTLCHKNTIEDSIYSKCEIGKIMVSYDSGDKC